MSRAENFSKMADLFGELADHCLRQKDTIAWWTEFGQKWQDVAHLVMDTPAKKDTHMQAAQRAAHMSAEAREAESKPSDA